MFIETDNGGNHAVDVTAPIVLFIIHLAAVGVVISHDFCLDLPDTHSPVQQTNHTVDQINMFLCV